MSSTTAGVALADADRDAPALTDEVAEAEGVRCLGPAERAEEVVDEQRPGEPEQQADERGPPGVQVEHLGAEQPADAEHRDEAEQQRHERDAADVEVDVEGVEEAAEDVVDEHRQQQQAPADQQAADEDRVREIDRRYTPPMAPSAGRPVPSGAAGPPREPAPSESTSGGHPRAGAPDAGRFPPQAFGLLREARGSRRGPPGSTRRLRH